MNTKRFLCAALGAVCCFAFMQAQVRTEQTFEKGWKFTREDNAEFANPGYNDSKWQNVTVPHDWAIYGPFLFLIHISEPTRLGMISYAVFCLQKKKETSRSQIPPP